MEIQAQQAAIEEHFVVLNESIGQLRLLQVSPPARPPVVP